jgi:endonuclease YncB( thermonuclease family)
MIRHMRIIAALLLALAAPAAADAVRVIDGDTIVHRGQTIRIMGLDAPEVHHRCPEEKALAERARARHRSGAWPRPLGPRVGRGV